MPLRLVTFLASFLLLAAFGGFFPVYAELACTANISPTSVDNGTTTNFGYTVTNQGTESVAAVRITNPDSGVFLINSGSASGWDAGLDGAVITFSGGSIDVDESATFTISVTALAVSEAKSFSLEISSNNSDFAGCSGSGGVAVVVPGAASPTPTPAASSTTTTTTTTTVTVTASPTPTPKPLVDTVAPTVIIETDFTEPFEQVPLIEGKAVDFGAINVGVAKVEYSIDEGKNWSPVDNIEQGLGSRVQFEFTPVIFEDGDYQIKVRAKDNSGNVGSSQVYKLVIDRLSPQVAGILYSIGGQVLPPRGDGTIIVPEGLSIKITLSAVGGPITIDITSSTKSQITNSKLVSLVKNLDSGLWSGTLSFAEPGTYKLTATAVDGAENTTERQLNNIVVLPSGQILDENGKGIKGAEVALYYFEPTTLNYTLWDGAPFGQENPQKTDAEGRYGLLVPAGKYYLQISAPGYKTLRSEIFSIYSTLSINSVFNLKPGFGFRFGQWFFGIPDFKSESVKVTLPVITTETKNALMGSEMPFFEFDKGVSTTDLRGQPTIYTFAASWSPPTYDEIPILEELTLANKEIKTVLVMSQETWSKIQTFKKLGGYKTEILTDADGKLVVPLNILNYPTHVFVDRKGIIKNIKTGVLTKEELLEGLVN